MTPHRSFLARLLPRELSFAGTVLLGLSLFGVVLAGAFTVAYRIQAGAAAETAGRQLFDEKQANISTRLNALFDGPRFLAATLAAAPIVRSGQLTGTAPIVLSGLSFHPAIVNAKKKWLPGSAEGFSTAATIADPRPAAAAAPGNGPVNERAIKDMFGDDQATFKEVLDSFVAPSEEIVAAILAALGTRDAGAVKSAAHKLKSSARTVGAAELADTCAALEAAGKTADWTIIDNLAPQAEAQFKRVLGYIHAL